jgi:hypothetical protein
MNPGASYYSTVQKFNIPSPIVSERGTGILKLRNVTRVAEKLQSAFRSKFWRLRIVAFHRYAAVVTRDLYADEPAVRGALVRVSDIMGDSSSRTKYRFVTCFQAELADSAFEVDVSQLLHTKEKVVTLAKELISANCCGYDAIREDLMSLYDIMRSSGSIVERDEGSASLQRPETSSSSSSSSKISSGSAITDEMQVNELVAGLDIQISDMRRREVQAALHKRVIASQKLVETQNQLSDALRSGNGAYGTSPRHDWWIPLLQALSTKARDDGFRRLDRYFF